MRDGGMIPASAYRLGLGFQPTMGSSDSFAAEFARFADRVGDRLAARAPQPLRAIDRRGPASQQALPFASQCHDRSGRFPHLEHLPPQDRRPDDVRIFDWDSWRVDMATDDLAYMMALHWYPDLRRVFERPLLDHYHAELVAHGVTGYDRRALDDDYRLSVLWQIATPVWQAGLRHSAVDLVEQSGAYLSGRRRSRLSRVAWLMASVYLCRRPSNPVILMPAPSTL
jgi:hypothetical protein